MAHISDKKRPKDEPVPIIIAYLFTRNNNYINSLRPPSLGQLTLY